MKKLESTDSKIIKAIVLYNKGIQVKEICKNLHLDSQVLNRITKENGIKRDHAKTVRKGKSNSIIKDNALDILTSEALYWIGFLYADGHIEKERPRIRLVLSPVDRTHLEKFSKFFGENIPVTTLGSGFLRVSFSSKQIINKLKELGFTNRKTYDITPHPLLKGSRDFWRGCVDGDGWIYNKSQRAVGLCGHSNTITEFINFLNLNGIETKATPSKKKKREFLWSCDIHSNKAQRTADILYKDSTLYLDRKYETYKNEFCNIILNE